MTMNAKRRRAHRKLAALQIAKTLSANRVDTLPARVSELDSLPGGLGIRLIVAVIGAAAAIESVLPRFVPRIVQRVAATS